jgi:(5-formylfuran-3-yl)methyl phosphate synthase
MQLLVSVRDEIEAAAAVAGGADIIDAKEPLAGALGAVSSDVLRAIVAVVGGARPVTAALGDAADESAVERDARAFAAAGVTFVKIGFAGVTARNRVDALIAAAVRGAGEHVIAVAYADHERAGSAPTDAIFDAAVHAGAAGLLIDTADKSGPGLLGLMSPEAIGRAAARTRGAGLIAALAGRLTAADLPIVRDTGADIAGVRGAACDEGRTGHISAVRIALLARLLGHERGGYVVSRAGFTLLPI